MRGVNAPAAAAAKPQPAGFAPGKLASHFNKHVREWEETLTEETYLKKAQDLLQEQPGGDILGHTTQNGYVFRYNQVTNEFLSVKPDSTIETFFRPKAGMEYWLKQLERYP